jgi:hypothetical protein
MLCILVLAVEGVAMRGMNAGHMWSLQDMVYCVPTWRRAVAI